jgi:hypothetical protein
MNQRSTVGKIATDAKVSYHKARQAGRGKRKETLKTNSSEGFPTPDQRSTVGKIAACTKVSYHKARQVVAVSARKT